MTIYHQEKKSRCINPGTIEKRADEWFFILFTQVQTESALELRKNTRAQNTPENAFTQYARATSQ